MLLGGHTALESSLHKGSRESMCWNITLESRTSKKNRSFPPGFLRTRGEEPAHSRCPRAGWNCCTRNLQQPLRPDAKTSGNPRDHPPPLRVPGPGFHRTKRSDQAALSESLSGSRDARAACRVSGLHSEVWSNREGARRSRSPGRQAAPRPPRCVPSPACGLPGCVPNHWTNKPQARLPPSLAERNVRCPC